MTTNCDRAEWARLALDAFSGHGGPYMRPDAEDMGTRISDLICNLLHLARREAGVTDIEHYAARAAAMNAAEVAEDDEG